MASEHSELLKASVADFATRGTDIARVRALRSKPQEYDRAVWRQMAELGWLGILVPESYGGMGLGLTDTAVIAEGLARALVPEPFTSSAVLATTALCASQNETLKRELLPALVSGSSIATLAWQEEAGQLDHQHIAMRATPFEGGYRLTGTKKYVTGAAGADLFIVAARTDAGLVLGCMERETSGVSVELQALADGRHFATVTFDDAIVQRDRVAAEGNDAGDALACAIDRATAIASAELYGVMCRTLEMSVDYMKTRVQFGKPIGSFQALQHRAVDLYIQQQLASAVLNEALRELDRDPAPPRRAALVSRMKARCSDAGVRIGREAIQIHGAIGFTDEYDAGLYLKRALVLGAWLGTATQHRRRYAALTLSAASSREVP